MVASSRTLQDEDLDEAVNIAREAADITPPNHPDLASRLNDLGSALAKRYSRNSKIEDLEQAISSIERAVDLTPPDHPDLASRLDYLGMRLADRCDHATGKTVDLEQSISYIQRAVDITPPDHPNLASYLSDLGGVLAHRYDDVTGETKDLEQAISYAQRAVDITPPDHPDLAGRLNNLAATLIYQANRTGQAEDLDEAISNIQGAVDVTPPDHPELARYLSNLACMLLDRYDRSGRSEDLEEAITNGRRAVDMTPPDHPWLATRLNNLAVNLSQHYHLTGKTGDLEEAISNSQRAVDITPPDHSWLAGYLSELGCHLSKRYDRTGKSEDLEEAITNTRRAVDMTPPDHPWLATRLNNLGNRLSERHDRTGKSEDLEEAISNAQRAVDISSPDRPNLATFLTNLGSRFSEKYHSTGKPKDQDEAISYSQRAVDITPPDSPHLALMLSNMGVMLSERYERTGKTEDLEAAIMTAQKGIDMTPPDHPALAKSLNQFGDWLLSRYNRTGDPKDRNTALDHYLNACASAPAIPLHRVQGARKAIQQLVDQGDLQRASSVAKMALELLPVVCSRYLSRKDQQHAVSQTAGLAADACSLSIRAENDPNTALEHLEHGRGLIIGYLIDGRGDTSELRKVASEKADEFENLRYKAFRPIAADESPEVRRQMLREREAAAKDLEACLADIRSVQELPNHARFLLPPSADDLKSYATDGPIIVVNVTTISSDALIVTTSGVDHVLLPKLDKSEMEIYRQWGLTRGANRDGNTSRKSASKDRFRGFLSRLWSSCVCLVLEKLGMSERPTSSELPRIWWMGTGLAGSLPFHAAGDHSVGSVANTLSCAISSYTPMIKALRHAREKATMDIDKHSILLVTMAQTPGHTDLPGVEDEERAIIRIVQDPHSVQSLRRPSARTVLDMLNGDMLESFNIVHFACHGSADLTDPSNSFLALQGSSDSAPDKLTVQAISDANVEKARLAYLSACSTAETRVSDLADDALHLASSFLVAGFGHVVASMWPSNDRICANIASSFYRNLLMKGGTEQGNRAVAAALHSAVLEVRSQNLERPHLWAQHIHSGA
ncbi:uncharacterized protein TRUGW13939_11994 [Talaromyces rugulosus]|uniref:CHAT domain-containing protein n=1 Tax=Talaromyces rugulosus TaxID=121627 RepID=A0A7H8RFJ2_TALRU|nr:uncharacterized protein TRUGW13939_11994 [Talaromyces rugulosus]QKX64818.1 hypothetical protein TRUGW13939_11994 [Talaromyces rugulosus]